MKKNINIRVATENDLDAIYALVHELAVYERAPEAHTATLEQYKRDFKAGIFEAHVAIDSDAADAPIIGMIFYYMAYSTWKGRMLYLEDFVVTESYRQYGVGFRGL